MKEIDIKEGQMVFAKKAKTERWIICYYLGMSYGFAWCTTSNLNQRYKNTLFWEDLQAFPAEEIITKEDNPKRWVKDE